MLHQHSGCVTKHSYRITAAYLIESVIRLTYILLISMCLIIVSTAVWCPSYAHSRAKDDAKSTSSS